MHAVYKQSPLQIFFLCILTLDATEPLCQGLWEQIMWTLNWGHSYMERIQVWHYLG